MGKRSKGHVRGWFKQKKNQIGGKGGQKDSGWWGKTQDEQRGGKLGPSCSSLQLRGGKRGWDGTAKRKKDGPGKSKKRKRVY